MILVSYNKVFFSCVLLIASSAPSSAYEEGSWPPAKCSAAKERLRRALVKDGPHIRTRRTIEVPPGTGWECKWALNIPFETQARYSARLQLSIPVIINIPAFMYDDHGLEKLFGFYKEKGGKDGKLTKRIGYEGYDPDFDATLFGSNSNYFTPKVVEQGSAQGVPRYHRRTTRSVALSRAIQSERMELYYRVEGLVNKFGLPGPICLQRTICELAQDPIEYGIVGDLINLFFTPSLATLHQDFEDFGKLDDYVNAERHGEGGGRCGARYGNCPVSMFELLPVVVNSLLSQ